MLRKAPYAILFKKQGFPELLEVKRNVFELNKVF